MNKWSRFKFTPNLPLGANGERVTGSKAHIELSKEAAKEGMVLLKNENNVLPLAAGSKVALFGKGTFDYVKGGGGSGDVTVEYVTSLYQGLSDLKDRVHVFEGLSSFYQKNFFYQFHILYLQYQKKNRFHLRLLIILLLLMLLLNGNYHLHIYRLTPDIV